MLKPDFTFFHTVTVQRWLRRGIMADEYGEPEAIRCRVNFKRNLSYANAANSTATATDEITASGTIFMPAGTRIDAKDKLIFNGRNYAVLGCQPCYDFRGVENHVEVDIQ